MMLVEVDLLKLKVGSFSAKDDSVVLEVHFNDGENKQIFRTTKLEKPEDVVKDIYAELIRMEENINMRFDGATMVSNVNVLIKNREKNKKKMINFFKKIRIMIEKIKSMKVAEGYLDMISDINRMELEL